MGKIISICPSHIGRNKLHASLIIESCHVETKKEKTEHQEETPYRHSTSE